MVGDPAVDPRYQMQPILPYSHQAFGLLGDWVENGVLPPESQSILTPQDKKKAIDSRTGGEIDMLWQYEVMTQNESFDIFTRCY